MNNSSITNVKNSLTPKQGINHKSISNQFKFKKNKDKKKLISKFRNSNIHLNEILEKMKCFKQLLYKTNDIKSFFILDTYGLKYTKELKKMVNSRVKIHMFNTTNNNINKFKKKIQKNKKNEEKKNSKLYYSFNKEKRASQIKEEENKEDDFDLDNVIETNNEKILNKEFIINARKNKKLLNLKSQINYAEKHPVISNKKIKNLLFVRDVIKKNKYDRVKSKYRRPKTADARFKNNISKINNNNHNLITVDFKNELGENLTIKTPNISLYKDSNNNNRSSFIPIKQKYKHIIFQNNFNEIGPQKYDLYEHQGKNDLNNFYDKMNKNESQEFNNNSILMNFNKKNLMYKLNKLENKSNIINQNFSNYTNKSQEISTKLFNPSTSENNEKNEEKVNIKEINEHFNFSKGFETDLESLLKKNADKVKKSLDYKCGRIVDEIVKEICLEEKNLHKNYFLYTKDLKPKDRSEVLKKYNDMYKGKKNDIFDIFRDKEKDEFINAIRFKKNYVNDIEQMYRKTKILNTFKKY